MSEKMECMCMDCNISHYIDLGNISLEDVADNEKRLVDNLFCSECCGKLFLNCKAGDEPTYRLK